MKYIVFFVLAFFLVGALTIPHAAGYEQALTVTIHPLDQAVEISVYSAYGSSKDVTVTINDSGGNTISVMQLPVDISNYANTTFSTKNIQSGTYTVEVLVGMTKAQTTFTTTGGSNTTNDETLIPSWIKNNAGWWADDKIDDFTFAQGIAYLIKNKIIQINDLPTTPDGKIIIEQNITIPSWIKNNADWWASNSISDSDFLYGIKYLVETNIIEFQSDNIEQYILDWDTIVHDSMYAYDGSIKVQSKFFDYVNYTVRYDTVKNNIADYSDPTLLRAGVWLYQITGNEKFLQNAGIVADVIEELYLTDLGIVMNVHPITNVVESGEAHTNQEILGQVAKLALVDSNYTELTKTLADAVIEHEVNHETDLFYTFVTLDGKPVDRSMYMSYTGSVGLESLLLAYEVTSDRTYLEQVKRTILAYWDLSCLLYTSDAADE